MANAWIQPITVLSILTLLSPGDGEKFFQYRDHRDQGRYEVRKHSMSVHNTLEAELQLEKYGYLKCRINRRKRSVPSFTDILRGLHPTNIQEGDLRECSNREVRHAIRQYQKTYKLPPTGVLDAQTKKFMSTSRCGNADKEENKNKDLVNVKENIQRTSKEVLKEFINKQTKHNENPSSEIKSRPWKRSTGSRIMKVIAAKDTVPSLERRRRYLHEYVEKLKKEDPMMLSKDKKNSENVINIRKKRSVAADPHENDTHILVPVEDGDKFDKQIITWRLLESGYSTRIPVEDQRATIDLAFRMWSEVIPLNFVETTDGDIEHVDIEVAFGTGAHQNCERDFDGRGGEIAHSFHTGNMHFDDDENFKSLRSFTPDGIYLLRVAVHEIGHVLGLIHTNKKYSIMYAIYEAASSNPDFELGWEDRKAVQRVYGVCKGKFNVVFDWVRKRPDNQFIYNTYFFRVDHYWMYENHANRTRYGDPLVIAREWENIPDEMDGFAHVWYIDGNDVVDDSYFYKGENYYKYDSENDRVYDGWPKLIAEGYPAKPGDPDAHPIPDNVDSVFFDARDKNIYFFKDGLVYVFDPKEPEETRGCCVRIRNISEEYPLEEGSRPLPDKLDAVYYSYKDDAMYFIKDEDVWVNVLFSPKQNTIKNLVKYDKKWYEKWFDICEVQHHFTHMHDVMPET